MCREPEITTGYVPIVYQVLKELRTPYQQWKIHQTIRILRRDKKVLNGECVVGINRCRLPVPTWGPGYSKREVPEILTVGPTTSHNDLHSCAGSPQLSRKHFTGKNRVGPCVSISYNRRFL